MEASAYSWLAALGPYKAKRQRAYSLPKFTKPLKHAVYTEEELINDPSRRMMVDETGHEYDKSSVVR